MKYRKIGITGLMGSGKSEVGKMLRKLGYRVIDADQVARDVVCPGRPGYAAIQAHFPSVVTAAGIDRKALGALVFSDETKRKQLNALLHPLIVAAIVQQMAMTDERIFVEAPLLFEAGLEQHLDLVIEVTAPREHLIQRIVDRERMTPEQAAHRLKSFHDTGKRAHHTLCNDADLTTLEKRLKALLREIP